MYRLVVYELIFLLVVAGVLGAVGLLPYSPLYLAFSTVALFGVCLSVNTIFAYMFDVPANPESTWITALILALIIKPPVSFWDAQFLPLALWAGAWAIASKYILAIKGKHLFNPAALGVAITSLVLGLSASWWVGTPVMAPFVLLGGLLIVRKIHRFDLWLAFVATFATGILYSALSHGSLAIVAGQSFLYAPVFFFSTVMLTEPATMPSTRSMRILYGMLVGLLFLPNVSIGSFYFTPELALLLGNIFVYSVSPKYKLVLELVETVPISHDTCDFIFKSNRPLTFQPGQYMELTVKHEQSDARGMRRYFTLASSPTEKDVRFGIKFYEPASSFKKALLLMRPGDSLAAGQLAGDFTLPRDKKKKLVFVAGGIGITPFRSIAQYLIDTKQKRDAILLYSNKTSSDIVYEEVFAEAGEKTGLKTVYVITDEKGPCYTGVIDQKMLIAEVPDYKERTFYISGPQRMVTGFTELLENLGVSRSQIKTDYFPGFA